MKSVIYNMNTGEIVKITEEAPEFKELKEEEDFDSYKNWMMFAESAERVRIFERTLCL